MMAVQNSAEKIVVFGFRHFFDTEDGPVQATGEIDLKIGTGEFVTLVGPSGCGKTTTLRMVAGFETHTTEHFAVRFNAATDPFLGDEVLSYMEGNYARICGNFVHEPGERTFIELMPENQDFSVRTSGRPWHATYAVTQGVADASAVSIVPEIAKGDLSAEAIERQTAKAEVSSFFQVPAEDTPAEDGTLTAKDAGSN